MISGAAAVGGAVGQKGEEPEKPDTHAIATYIKRLMKRDGQEVSAVDINSLISVHYRIGPMRCWTGTNGTHLTSRG